MSAEYKFRTALDETRLMLEAQIFFGFQFELLRRRHMPRKHEAAGPFGPAAPQRSIRAER